MANVVELLALQDVALLSEMAEELDGVLSNIAHNGKAEDRKYIENAQKELREKWEIDFERIYGDHSHIGLESGIGRTIEHIGRAYDGVQTILGLGDSAEDIEREAGDLLHENLILPEDME